MAVDDKQRTMKVGLRNTPGLAYPTSGLINQPLHQDSRADADLSMRDLLPLNAPDFR